MRKALRIFVIAVVAVVCTAWLLSSATAQKRSRNEFFHSTAAHKKGNCASCHNNPTPNWQKARGFPDVADYPGHKSCLGCHHSDFFSGNSPVICKICHTSSSPSGSPHLPFPVRSRSREFTTIFPHDVHQDIIARNENPDGTAPSHFAGMYGYLPSGGPEGIVPSVRQQDAAATAGRMPALRWEDATVASHFVAAVFVPNGSPLVWQQSAATTARGEVAALQLDDPPPPTFNNCVICHQSTTARPKFGNREKVRGQALADAEAENFIPGDGFFKTAPEGHASCFSCHYQGLKPAGTDCAGCHRPAAPYLASDVIKRYSVKFDHQNKNHVKDCTTCHVRITQNSDVATMKDADVPFQVCVVCHNHQDELKNEKDKRAESIAAKQPAFQCVRCHSPGIGRFEIPASHRNR